MVCQCIQTWLLLEYLTVFFEQVSSMPGWMLMNLSLSLIWTPLWKTLCLSCSKLVTSNWILGAPSPVLLPKTYWVLRWSSHSRSFLKEILTWLLNFMNLKLHVEVVCLSCLIYIKNITLLSNKLMLSKSLYLTQLLVQVVLLVPPKLWLVW